MSRRTVALVIALLLAAFATIVLVSYIQGVEHRTNRGQVLVDVFVAKQDIPAGVTGDTLSQQGLIERRSVTTNVRPPGAITSLEQISGRLTAAAIFKGETIIQQRFVLPGAALKGVLPIPPGKQAISVQVAQPPGVGGFVQPGDQVSLIVQAPRSTGNFVHYLIQNLDVLAVGTRVVSGAGLEPAAQQQQQGGCCLLTFAVTPAQAEQIVFAVLNTQLYFTLLPAKAPAANPPGRTAQNLFS
jgi:pilus assembly protein CpaB